MLPETRGGKQLVKTLQRKPLTPRRAAGIIATYTLVITIAGGVVAWLADRKDFHSLGAGTWWALQTVTTVGYGDVVPRGTGGRVIGAVVMVSGIGFLTVITASVTAALIEAARRRGARPSEPDLGDRLEEINTRLRAIEERLR
jgi:voltage-gated potassium channel